MNLTKKYMTKNRCYTNGTKIQVTKLVLHSTGCAQPDADVHIGNWNTAISSACPHAFIETDRVVQTLPWDFKGWHVGLGSKGSYNSCSIGVEICEPKGHTYKNGSTMVNYDVKKNEEYFAKVYENAVELFARLCYDFLLDPMKDILCHSEVHALGYGSNHGDVMHWFPKHGKSMDTFRADVRARIMANAVPNSTITVNSSTDDINWLKSKINKVIDGIYPKLDLNGVYDAKTRIAVLITWELFGWNKDGQDDGWRAGAKTIKRLTQY
ncbi:MAG: N-acetylmuramoyl-L-alanine amidase family 2 [Herbinix sp.]|jgi:N-acetyl-anhydromuramyl-L-alanine amidase AmpD|nr:N-acetylmuramoyl-L-alanine amidase family 2 [Herbinix sp.]